jgi:hypothetical protein
MTVGTSRIVVTGGHRSRVPGDPGPRIPGSSRTPGAVRSGRCFTGVTPLTVLADRGARSGRPRAG